MWLFRWMAIQLWDYQVSPRLSICTLLMKNSLWLYCVVRDRFRSRSARVNIPIRWTDSPTSSTLRTVLEASEFSQQTTAGNCNQLCWMVIHPPELLWWRRLLALTQRLENFTRETSSMRSTTFQWSQSNN